MVMVTDIVHICIERHGKLALYVAGLIDVIPAKKLGIDAYLLPELLLRTRRFSGMS